MRNTLILVAAAAALTSTVMADVVIDFNELAYKSGNYYNGADGSGGFAAHGATLNNAYTDWGGGYYSWSGFAYSRASDTTTMAYGTDGEFSAITGSGIGGTGSYLVGYVSAYSGDAAPTITLPQPTAVKEISITNDTLTYLAIGNGLYGARAFTASDWLRLTITGVDATGGERSVNVALATGTDRLSTWQAVDLTSLGDAVKALRFSMTGTDNDPMFGLNTPAYFAADNLVVAAVPEPTAMAVVGLVGLLLYRRSCQA